MPTKRIKDLTSTATAADLLSGRYGVLDTPDITKKLPGNLLGGGGGGVDTGVVVFEVSYSESVADYVYPTYEEVASAVSAGKMPVILLYVHKSPIRRCFVFRWLSGGYAHFDNDIRYVEVSSQNVVETGYINDKNLAADYDPEATYPIIGTSRMHEGVLYRSKVAINTPEDWTEAHWEVTDIISEINKVYGNLLNIDILSLITDWVDITDYIVYRNNFQPKYTSEYSTLTAEYSPSTNLVRFGGHRRVIVSSKSFPVKSWQTAVDIEHPSFYGFKVASIEDMPSFYFGSVYSQGAQFYPGVDSNGGTNGIYCQLGTINSATDDNNAGIAFKPVINDASSGYSNNKGVQFPDCVLKVKRRV